MNLIIIQAYFSLTNYITNFNSGSKTKVFITSSQDTNAPSFVINVQSLNPMIHILLG